jgi:hypothetical protein
MQMRLEAEQASAELPRVRVRTRVVTMNFGELWKVEKDETREAHDISMRPSKRRPIA